MGSSVGDHSCRRLVDSACRFARRSRRTTLAIFITFRAGLANRTAADDLSVKHARRRDSHKPPVPERQRTRNASDPLVRNRAFSAAWLSTILQMPDVHICRMRGAHAAVHS